MPKVSVIIPVYGVEKYIERCARSLFEQTLDDIEYIFVDDCTKDDSMAVLQKVVEDYPNRKPQVKILRHEHNKGLPLARRTGLLSASGEYVAHCDSDDWVDRDMYKTMYASAVKDNADIVVCDYYKAKGQKDRPKRGCRSTDKKQFLEDLVYKKTSWAVWNKLCKRSLYQADITFPQDTMGEDMALIIQLVCRAKKISYVPSSFYYYFINPTSVIRTKSEASSLVGYNQQKNNTAIVLKALQATDDVSIHTGYEGYLYFLSSINFTPLAYHNAECLKMWRQECPSLRWRFYLNSRIPFRYKFKYTKLMVYHLVK